MLVHRSLAVFTGIWVRKTLSNLLLSQSALSSYKGNNFNKILFPKRLFLVENDFSLCVCVWGRGGGCWPSRILKLIHRRSTYQQEEEMLKTLCNSAQPPLHAVRSSRASNEKCWEIVRSQRLSLLIFSPNSQYQTCGTWQSIDCILSSGRHQG